MNARTTFTQPITISVDVHDITKATSYHQLTWSYVRLQGEGNGSVNIHMPDSGTAELIAKCFPIKGGAASVIDDVIDGLKRVHRELRPDENGAGTDEMHMLEACIEDLASLIGRDLK